MFANLIAVGRGLKMFTHNTSLYCSKSWKASQRVDWEMWTILLLEIISSRPGLSCFFVKFLVELTYDLISLCASLELKISQYHLCDFYVWIVLLECKWVKLVLNNSNISDEETGNNKKCMLRNLRSYQRIGS